MARSAMALPTPPEAPIPDPQHPVATRNPSISGTEPNTY